MVGVVEDARVLEEPLRVLLRPVVDGDDMFEAGATRLVRLSASRGSSGSAEMLLRPVAGADAVGPRLREHAGASSTSVAVDAEPRVDFLGELRGSGGLDGRLEPS